MGARCPGNAAGGRAGWRRAVAPPPASGGRCRAVLTLATGGARSRASGAAAGVARCARGQHGGQAAHPHGQREAQQEHHAARERRQDLEDGPGGEGVGRALAAGAVHLRGLRISHLPDHPEHPDGHVRGQAPGGALPCPRRCPEPPPSPGSRRGAVLALAVSHSRSLQESFRVSQPEPQCLEQHHMYKAIKFSC